MRHPPRLTSKVHDLVALDRMDRPSVSRLTAAQVETLIAVARTPEAFAERVSAPRAIQALARGAKGEVAIPVLGRIVGAAAASVTARVTAARELGLIATSEAEQALLRRIGVRDPHVLQEVLWGLGALGGPAALRQLGRLAEPDNIPVRRQLTLARALIAHRHGLDGAFLPAVEGQVRRPQQMGHPTTLTMEMKTPAATAKDRERLSGSTYGIELAQYSAALVCGRNEWTVFFNRELEPSVIARRLLERPWIVALLGRWHLERRTAIVKHVVLARPEGPTARIDVIRTDGERMYTGRAEPDDSGFTFSIADLHRPGTAPTNVTGRMTGRRITLERVVASSKRVAVRSTISVPRATGTWPEPAQRSADKR